MPDGGGVRILAPGKRAHDRVEQVLVGDTNSPQQRTGSGSRGKRHVADDTRLPTAVVRQPFRVGVARPVGGKPHQPLNASSFALVVIISKALAFPHDLTETGTATSKPVPEVLQW
jgi:hypothetical protein